MVVESMTDDARGDLLACPFCGEPPYARAIGGPRELHIIGCKNDGCEINPKASGETSQEVAETWNTRAAPAPADDARGELLALADAGLRHAEGLSAQLERPDWKPSRAHIEQSRNSIKRLAEALRPAPVPQCEAAPVAWVPENYHRWLTPHGAPAQAAMMWKEKSEAYTTPLYAAPPSRLDAGSVEARSHWAIEASIPEDGFECYYLLRDDITVAEICGHQTEQRGRHLDDLVVAANGNTLERKILASQAMEYARRLNDIAVNCEIAALEGDASDLRRIAEWLAALSLDPGTVTK